jgi:polysaccharide export outer membrane protein
VLPARCGGRLSGLRRARSDSLLVRSAISRDLGFVNGRLDTLQALSQAGFSFKERSEGTLFVVDVERILDGDAANFHLMPGDIIFVPTTWVTDWNNALSKLLPTLQTISGLLSPFVQIKYLSQ